MGNENNGTNEQPRKTTSLETNELLGTSDWSDMRTMIASTHDVAKGGRAPRSTQNVCNDHDGTAKPDTFDVII